MENTDNGIYLEILDSIVGFSYMPEVKVMQESQGKGPFDWFQVESHAVSSKQRSTYDKHSIKSNYNS